MKTSESQEPDINADIKQLTPERLNAFMALLGAQHGLTEITGGNFTRALDGCESSGEFYKKGFEPIIRLSNVIGKGVKEALRKLKADEGAAVDAGS